MYLKIAAPFNGYSASALKFFFFISLFFFIGLIESQSQSQTIGIQTYPCTTPVQMDTNCCDYITNGNFNQLIDDPNEIDNFQDIPVTNWWNHYYNNGFWQCLTPNYDQYGVSTLPDLFSQLTNESDFQVPFNIYSDSQMINDPSFDGNYAAINVYNSPATYWDERSYLEQELSDYLYSGFTYQLSYNVSFTPESSHSSNIGVYLTPEILDLHDFSNTPINSEILHNTPNVTGGWDLIQNTFTVGQNGFADELKYITIGHLHGSTPIEVNSTIIDDNGNFYIDSIHLKLVSAPDTIFYDTICGNSSNFFESPYRYHRCATWSVVSGPATIDTSYTDSVYVILPIEGDYIIQYELVCDSVTYTETYEYTVMEEYGLSQDTIIVCDTHVNLNQYTNGAEGEWSLIAGEGSFYQSQGNTFFTNYGIGTHQLMFVPDQNSLICDLDSNYLWITYQPFPKTTWDSQEEDIWEDIEVDWEGSVYAVGTFINRTFIEGNEISIGLPQSVELEQFMVVKYDSCGTLLWYAWGKSVCPYPHNYGWSTGTEIEVDEQYHRVYIAGKFHGMQFENSNGNEYFIQNSVNPFDIDDVNCSVDPIGDNYILELNSDNGNYEDFKNHIGDITNINAMELATDGPYEHYLYLGGNLVSPSTWNGSVVKINTHSNFLDPINLTQNNSHIASGSSERNEINDLFYRNQSLYSIGTTEGVLSIGGQVLNYADYSVHSTAWVSKIFDGSNGFTILALNHGGHIPGNPFPERRMSGENIYVDQYGSVIVSGLFSGVIVNPFGFPGMVIETWSHLVNQNPLATDAYILKLNDQSLVYNGGFDLIRSMADGEIKNIEMGCDKNEVFLSATYTDLAVDFELSSGANDINLTSIPGVTDNEKILITNYTISNTLTKNWHNTTLTFNSDDAHYTHATAAKHNKAFTGGQYERFIDFTFYNNGIIDAFGMNNSKLRAMLFRNDNVLQGMFKNYSENEETTIKEASIQLYPNPNNGEFVINGNINYKSIEVYSVLGSKLQFEVFNISDKEARIRINNYTGLVIVNVNGESHRLIIK